MKNYFEEHLKMIVYEAIGQAQLELMDRNQQYNKNLQRYCQLDDFFHQMIQDENTSLSTEHTKMLKEYFELSKFMRNEEDVEQYFQVFRDSVWFLLQWIGLTQKKSNNIVILYLNLFHALKAEHKDFELWFLLSSNKTGVRGRSPCK